jgi:CheY-like chemotaxis protein
MTRPTLLVADDNPKVLKMLERYLPPSWRMERALNGQEALEKARRLVLRLLLLDVRMPGLGGLEVLRRLRADPMTRHLPIYVFSASGALELRRATVAAGADGFFVKPITRKKLESLLRHFDTPVSNPM